MTTIMTMHDDLANRDRDIHWPPGFEPEKADLFAHNETVINASCERVWKHIVEATTWPAWYPNSKDVHIIANGDGILGPDTVFRWTTFAAIGPGPAHLRETDEPDASRPRPLARDAEVGRREFQLNASSLTLPGRSSSLQAKR
jgi:hypothetical protein